jgi:hypothetical protein
MRKVLNPSQATGLRELEHGKIGRVYRLNYTKVYTAYPFDELRNAGYDIAGRRSKYDCFRSAITGLNDGVTRVDGMVGL